MTGRKMCLQTRLALSCKRRYNDFTIHITQNTDLPEVAKRLMKQNKTLLIAALLVLAVFAVWRLWDVCMLFMTAMIIAYLLGPLARLFHRRLHLRRGLAVGLVLFLFLFLVVLLFSLTLPRIVTQAGALLTDIRIYSNNFDELVSSAVSYLERLNLPPSVIETAAGFLAQSDGYIAGFLNSIVSSLAGVPMRLFDGIVVFILVFYFMLDGEMLKDKLISLLPQRFGGRVRLMLSESNRLTWAYIRTRCLISFGMAVVTYVGLSLMGLQYAYIFAALSFLLDFIPYFGSIIAGVVEGFFALITGGVGLAVGVVIFVLIVQQIEGNVVAPKLQGSAVGLHPVTVLFAMLASNAIWGPVGMLISVPVAAILKIIAKEIYTYLMSAAEPALAPEAGAEK